MKATNSNFSSIAQRAAKGARIFFFCGPDEAGAHAAATKIVDMMGDAGERVEIDGAEVRRDPVRLSDETRSTSLFGDRRHIFVRAQGEEALEAVKILIEDAASLAEGWPVLIVAQGASDKSRTAKLLEKRDDALVAMFHPPDLRSVSGEVRQIADAAGLRMTTELAERIASATGLDIRMAAAEIEKLALYLDAAPANPRAVEHADIDVIGAACEDDAIMPLVDAVLSGDDRRLPAEMAKFRQGAMNPIGTLLAMERRVAQLSALSAKMGGRGNAAEFVKAEVGARRIFFRDGPAISAQLQRWQGPKLSRLAERLIALHAAMISDHRAAELLFAGECTQIARAARGSRR